MFNRAVFIGRVAREPHINERNGKKVAYFVVAVPQRQSSPEQPSALFLNCRAYGRLVDRIAHIMPGLTIMVDGRLELRTFTHRGETSTRYELICDDAEVIETG